MTSIKAMTLAVAASVALAQNATAVFATTIAPAVETEATSFFSSPVVSAILTILALLYVFLGLAIVCDDYLVPSIETLCEKLKIPEEAAGASFLAFGSAAPEILLNAVATAEGKIEAMESSLSAILGSAIIAFALIPALCTLVAPTSLMISWTPMIRDSMVYIASLGTLVYIMNDSQVGTWQSGLLILVYVGYMLIIFVPIWLRPADPDRHDEFITPAENHMIDHALAPHNPLLATSSSKGYGAVHAEEGAAEPAWLEPVRKVIDLLSRPFRILFAYSLPECGVDSPTRSYYPVTLVLSIVYVALLSAAALYSTRILTAALNLSTEVAGVTLLALGSQIPDTIASVSLARAGHADAAVCNAIGSQVINVTLGSGLPWFLYTLFHGEIHIPYEQETLLFQLLAVIIFAYLVLNLRGVFCACFSKAKGFYVGLSPRDGIALLVLYVAVNVWLVIKL
ncbi:hypothetical protein DYB25_005602 [Aphanomyces astaci]|uniref:Sodium/calcium exchanger membrane region domain-containing protein n=1 Tax=Aphanomyces astaci TaxID=112090 RepID=A0A397DIP2_APHAT|nr:hypothetical protein DYB25_005602 [Aphanomyces astaci]RHY66021.1 hypothetical protein DYB38_001622 [Aphanomyces astaci]RHY80796.1 hypothetical protein DYB26_004464 [Aphanomyces astaci]RHZ20353.1 hypothetical protein DYB31_001191 [Aphanomyces astaci]